jgi:cytochrome c biogenesis protein CcdA
MIWIVLTIAYMLNLALIYWFFFSFTKKLDKTRQDVMSRINRINEILVTK